MSRYIIAHCDRDVGAGWGHIFSEGNREIERDTRFVWNCDAEKLIHLDIMRDSKWREASQAEILDLEDSLKNANPDALDNPDDWGLDASDELPSWCADPEIGTEPGF